MKVSVLVTIMVENKLFGEVKKVRRATKYLES